MNGPLEVNKLIVLSWYFLGSVAVWIGKLGTVKSSKADLSSVSPSSKQIDSLWSRLLSLCTLANLPYGNSVQIKVFLAHAITETVY